MTLVIYVVNLVAADTAINTDLHGVLMENFRFTWEIYKRGTGLLAFLESLKREKIESATINYYAVEFDKWQN